MKKTLTPCTICVFLVVVCVSLSVFGCAGPRSSIPITAKPAFKNHLLEESAAGKQVEEARRMIEAGDFNVVIPRLLQIIGKYPRSRSALDARYWLGVSYYNIRGYQDAISLFQEYLAAAPHGEFAEDSARQIAKIRKEYTDQFGSPAKLDEEINALWDQVKAEPLNYKSKWDLAGLLWKRGDYDMAGELYANIVTQYPEYATDSRLRNRIEFYSDGSYMLLTPDEKQKRSIEQEPLLVRNLNSFRSGRDLFTREERFYVVSGQTSNRGDSILYGVRVNVTIYGFGNIIYDTNTINIGRLNPGEARAFSVRFSNFDNMNNITRYEAIGSFQR